MVSTSSPRVSDAADVLAHQTWQLLCTRNRALQALLKSHWVWQVPGLSKWIVRLAWRQVDSQRDSDCCNCDDFRATVELARQLIEDREALEPLLADRPGLCDLLAEMERNSWVRVEVVSYYADRLRDIEQRQQCDSR